VAALKLIVLVLVSVALAQALGWPYLDQIALVLVGLLIAAYAWSKASVNRLAVVRETATDRLHVGQVLTERIAIRNLGRFAKLWLEVRDYSSLPDHAASRVVNVRGRNSSAWTVQTPCVRRGRYRIGPLLIASGDPFGLFPATLRIPGSHSLLVYPALVDVSGYPLPAGRLTAGATMTRRTQSVTPSVAGIRDYVPGDAFNRISWSTSARLGRLMVKEFDQDPTADLWIVLDLDHGYHRFIGADPPRAPAAPWLVSTEEYGVSISASLARRALAEGLNVGLIASCGRTVVLAPERSGRQESRIFEPLATVAADGARPLAEVLISERLRLRGRSSIVVVTPSTDDSWVAALAEVGGTGGRAAAIVLEAATFGAADPPMLVVGALAAAGVPMHLVKYGDDVSAALSGPRGGVRQPIVGRAFRG
jgi:uncharacterized protein (DUF58 family)